MGSAPLTPPPRPFPRPPPGVGRWAGRRPCAGSEAAREGSLEAGCCLTMGAMLGSSVRSEVPAVSSGTFTGQTGMNRGENNSSVPWRLFRPEVPFPMSQSAGHAKTTSRKCSFDFLPILSACYRLGRRTRVKNGDTHPVLGGLYSN